MSNRVMCIGFLFIILPASLYAGFFQDANRFFMTNVKNGGVNYEQIHQDPSGLDNLITTIEEYELEGTSKAEQKAFYINAYNLLMIKSIVDHYPVKSPLDIGGVFDKNKHNVAGQMLTLDEIEKGILMKEFFDPRLHFVLVCGAKGCPPLAPFAYMPAQLNELLDSRTQKTMNDPEFVRVDKENKTVALSKIFSWYKSDFLQNHESLIAYINSYRSQPIPTGYSIEFYKYDWSVNKKKVK